MTVEATTSAEMTIGAIRLAMEAGSNQRDKLALVDELLKRAAATPPDDTTSVVEFVEAVHCLDAKFEVRA